MMEETEERGEIVTTEFLDNEPQEITEEELDALDADVDVDNVKPLDWRKMLRRTNSGSVQRATYNAVQVMRRSMELCGLFEYDEHRDQIIISRDPPWADGKRGYPRELEPQDFTALCSWIDQQIRVDFGPDMIARVLVYVAKHWHTFNPLTAELDALKWDGVKRLPTWVHTHLGAPHTPVNSMIGTKYLVSAVARAYQPGCQADHMIILEGSQGIGKSSALRALFGQWYSEQFPDPKDKDAAMSIQGALCVESSELDSLTRSEANAMKAFITRVVDKYRPPYSPLFITRKRRCVFAGTTNDHRYLKDDSGGRRFWPVECGVIDVAAIKRDRDQFFAEAVVRFKAAEIWHPTREEAVALAALQSDRMMHDPWEDAVDEFLAAPTPLGDTRSEVTVREVLAKLGIQDGRQTSLDMKRVGALLRKAGWNRSNVRINGVQTKAFVSTRT